MNAAEVFGATLLGFKPKPCVSKSDVLSNWSSDVLHKIIFIFFQTPYVFEFII